MRLSAHHRGGRGRVFDDGGLAGLAMPPAVVACSVDRNSQPQNGTTAKDGHDCIAKAPIHTAAHGNWVTGCSSMFVEASQAALKCATKNTKNRRLTRCLGSAIAALAVGGSARQPRPGVARVARLARRQARRQLREVHQLCQIAL